jgi:hypothetical protein
MYQSDKALIICIIVLNLEALIFGLNLFHNDIPGILLIVRITLLNGSSLTI